MTIGRAAYERASTYPGMRAWPWDELDDYTKAMWEDIALAAVNLHIDAGETEE